MKCPRCGSLGMESDDACLRCGVRFAAAPAGNRNPFPARLAMIFAVFGMVAGQQFYKAKHPTATKGIDLVQATWAGAGSALFGTVGYALGAVLFGRKSSAVV